ncbi:MAG: hypothetical protein CHACPFDD_02569 [Phycisphaerae bacterium]|nr:hypothetical protein [Phycisphaerae bacterium]
MVGSFAIPDAPIRTLTISRQQTDPPPTITVKQMPPDVYNAMDVALSSDTPVTRGFGHGTTVTLRAQNLLPDFAFKEWLVDGTPVTPSPEPQQLTVNMLADHTAIPVYE